MNASRSRSSRQAVKVSSNWSTASTKRRSSRAPAGPRPARASAARRAGAALAPRLAARQHAAGERGQQAGPQHGGLAAARRSDDGEQRRPDEPCHELGDELLAPEEVLGVVDVEAASPLNGQMTRVSLVGAASSSARSCVDCSADDAARELRFQRPRLHAARGRAARDGVDPPRGLALRPLARDLVHAARHAAAGAQERFDGTPRGAAGA